VPKTITDPTQPSTCRDDEPPLLPKDEEPGASMTTRVRPNGSSAREPLHCPDRAADRELGNDPICTDLSARSMTDVLRHLQRPPHAWFVKRCHTCNDIFLDSKVFDQDHGENGQRCDTPKSQPRGDGQLEQWRLLRDQLKEIKKHTNVSKLLSAVKYFLTDLSSRLMRTFTNTLRHQPVIL
jgi:hypothetical protein